jgi:ABC-type oligopeptide transport system substrate-binding subunit
VTRNTKCDTREHETSTVPRGQKERESWRRAASGCIVAGVLALTLVALTGCRDRTPLPGPTLLVTVPVIETRVVEVTREIPVTATPSPMPVYSSPIGSAPGTLTYPLTNDPKYLDPQAAHDAAETLVVRQLYEGLFNLRGDGGVAPAAATRYEASGDARVYTVTLRSGLTWSDGEPLSADDFVAGFCRGLEPAVGAPLAYLVREAAPITGAAAYAAGVDADCGNVGVTAVNTATLQIALDAPLGFLPQLLTTSLFLPAPRDSGPITQTTIFSGTVGTPVNGPFSISERSAGRIVLTKNAAYWNAAEVDVERVELSVVPEPADQVQLFEEGGLQVAEFPAESGPVILANPALAEELHVLGQAGVSYLGLNTQRAPTDNVLVRQAIASAIDRQRLLSDVLQQPWHTSAPRLIPPGLPGYSGEGQDAVGYDPALARQLLGEAGYDEENSVPVVELAYNREGNNEVLFSAVGEMLEEVGIPVRLVSSRWDVYYAALRNCRTAVEPTGCSHNLYRMGWVLDYPDPSSLLRTLSPDSEEQYAGWQSEQYGEILNAASAETEEARRSELYRRAEALLLDEQAVVVPLVFYDRSLLVKAGLTFEFPAYGPPHFQYWRLRQ